MTQILFPEGTQLSWNIMEIRGGGGGYFLELHIEKKNGLQICVAKKSAWVNKVYESFTKLFGHNNWILGKLFFAFLWAVTKSM